LKRFGFRRGREEVEDDEEEEEGWKVNAGIYSA